MRYTWSDTCQRLANALAPAKYEVLICSAFRDPFSGGIGKQQVAIIAKHSAEAAWTERWKTQGVVDPPRGFAFALMKFGRTEIGFYSVHLKSNLVFTGGEKQVQLNILKRELSSEQLVTHMKNAVMDFPTLKNWVVAGDFNTNREQDLFVSEDTLSVFERAGFTDPLSALPIGQRITHPGKGRYPDATFDYVLLKGIHVSSAVNIVPSQASDHSLVLVDVELPK